MFDEEDFNEEEEEILDEESAPEEESFPVSSGKKNNGLSLSKLKQSAGKGSQQDANKLNGIIDKNKTRNAVNKINKLTTGKNSEEDKPEEEKTAKEKTEDKVIDAATDEALKKLSTMGIKGKLAAAAIKMTGSEEIIKQHIKQDLKKLKRAKKIQLFFTLLPYLLSLLLIILVITVVMTQTMLVVGKVNDALIGASTTIEKMSNLMTGKGWNTEEEVFFKTLKNEYNDSKRYIEDDGYIDVSLVAATIHYNAMIDVSAFEKDNGNTTDTSISEDAGSTNSLFGEFVDSENVKNFYYVANYKLGSLTTLVPGNRKLIGHMVDVDFSIKTTSSLTEAAQGWKNFINLIADDTGEIAQTQMDSMINIISPVLGLYKTYRQIVTDYENNSNNRDTKFDYQVRNVYYEAKELVESIEKMFSEIGFNPNDGDNGSFNTNFTGVFPYPDITMTLNDDKYYDYLVEVYIPGTFFSDNKNVSDSEIARMAKEIFEQRKAYQYLFGEMDVEMPSSCGSCNYDINGFNIGTNIYEKDKDVSLDNVKVRLMECNNGSDPIDDEDLVDFEKYVLGVTYAENGGAPTEALKVQAIAARSYALTRAVSRSKMKVESGQVILEMRNCTNDQVYCDPDKGCYANDKNTGSTVHSGTASNSSDQVKPPLSADSNIRTAVSDVAGILALDNDSNVVYTPYTAKSAQEPWNASAAAGKDYTEILLEHYSGSVFALSSSNCTNRCASGDYVNWKQFGESWSNIHLGTSSETIHSAGCLITSVSIQLARSGAIATVSPIDPGTVVEFLNNNGGFVSGGNFVWNSIVKLAPTFQYQGGMAKYNLCSNNKTKNVEIANQMIKDGCYVVAEVKSCSGGQHWVAIDKVEGGELYMMDPASTATTVFSKYTNVSKLQCYKVVK